MPVDREQALAHEPKIVRETRLKAIVPSDVILIDKLQIPECKFPRINDLIVFTIGDFLKVNNSVF